MSNGNWRDNEIRELLYVRADADIDKQIQGTARDSVVYDQITNLLRDRGVIRTKAQVISKLKALKKQYHEHNNNNNSDNNNNKTWPYFSLSEVIWGSNRSTIPVALVGSMETAATARSTGSTPSCCSDETPSTSSSSSGGLEVKHNDTGDETEVSLNDLVLSTESVCRSPTVPPAKKKRRTQTRSEKLFAEMRDLFSEMDKDFNERERLRLLEQREYDERVRREAREEKAKDMAVLHDMLRQLVQQQRQTPARQPQCPHSTHTSPDDVCETCFDIFVTKT